MVVEFRCTQVCSARDIHLVVSDDFLRDENHQVAIPVRDLNSVLLPEYNSPWWLRCVAFATAAPADAAGIWPRAREASRWLSPGLESAIFCYESL